MVEGWQNRRWVGCTGLPSALVAESVMLLSADKAACLPASQGHNESLWMQKCTHRWAAPVLTQTRGPHPPCGPWRGPCWPV
ncbi:MAG: hypothetical protein J3K34DRAFT_406695 [Monoraphidium minutum]|nr:MAG: hypothetical protein J3K34DRAFT_406695 [Monoraphidium minutum]